MTHRGSAKKKNPINGFFFICYIRGLLCLDHLSGLEAAGADPGLTNITVGIADGYLLNIRSEGSVAHPMRVADATTGNRMLSAYFAYL